MSLFLCLSLERYSQKSVVKSGGFGKKDKKKGKWSCRGDTHKRKGFNLSAHYGNVFSIILGDVNIKKSVKELLRFSRQ